MAELNAGDQVDELRVTPGQVPAAPLRGRLGRLQPDPHRPRVRQSGRPAEQHPPRPLLDGPRRPRQHRVAGGDPRALKRLSVQFRGMGVPEQEIVVSGTVKAVDGDTVVVDTVATQGENGSSATPKQKCEV